MSPKVNVVDQAAEKLVNIDNANHADERERSVHMEAQAFGMQLSGLTCWVGALVLAIFGQILTPLVLIILPVIPALGAQWYGRRRGVDHYRLVARGPAVKTLTWTGLYGLLLFTTCLAMVHRAYYGEGLLDYTVTVEVSEELQEPMAVVAIFGLGLGALVGVLWMGLIVRHQRRQEQKELDLAEDNAEATEISARTSARARPILLPIAGVLVALIGLTPWLMGGAGNFVAATAVFGLLYGAALISIYITWLRRGRRGES